MRLWLQEGAPRRCRPAGARGSQFGRTDSFSFAYCQQSHDILVLVLHEKFKCTHSESIPAHVCLSQGPLNRNLLCARRPERARMSFVLSAIAGGTQVSRAHLVGVAAQLVWGSACTIAAWGGGAAPKRRRPCSANLGSKLVQAPLAAAAPAGHAVMGRGRSRGSAMCVRLYCYSPSLALPGKRRLKQAGRSLSQVLCLSETLVW